MDVADLSGLPEGTRTILESEGIEALYPPQAEAVERGVLDGENLVASVPTASGKTLVGELAMLSAIDRGNTALFVVPLRALASEKAATFERWSELGVDVGVATGDYESTGERLADRDIVVATSEKVDSLVRNDAEWVDDVGTVVADEVHLVDDADRGPTLEVTLAKLRARADPQVVALSATIGNADEIAGWLDAELVGSDWRPIDLRTGVHYGDAVSFADGSQREVAVEESGGQTAALVADTVDEGGSALVFVNSRRNAESAAERLARVTSDRLDGDEQAQLAAVAEEIRGVSDTETSEELATAVASGAAFHHAGLAPDHRSLVEDAFRDRLLKVVCATPTLAAGVNTPARRVVVRDWRRYDGDYGGMKPLDALEVHQMFGRAGRPGLDPYGEAVLLASSYDEREELFERYVWAEPEPVRSKLAAEPALRVHLLSTVVSGFARSRDGLLDFLDRTLYASQTDDRTELGRVADGALDYLVENDFLDRSGDGLEATRLGAVVARLYLDPMSAAEIADGLERAAAAEREPTAFGLYHLVARTPDMYGLYLRSGDREAFTELCYEREAELLGTTPSEFDQAAFEEWLAALKTAALLEDWADERGEDAITEAYDVGPGDLRGKVETAEWLLGAAERLAAEVGAPVGPVRRARRRVEDGVRAELLDMTGVRGVGRKRARRLYDAGIEDRAALRTADKPVVLDALRGRHGTAERILDNAGRATPSMDGIERDTGRADAATTSAAGADGGDPRDEKAARTEGRQSDLGDFS